MSRTLAEMRASGRVSLPERTKTLCLAQALVAEAQSLESEREALVEAHDDAVAQATTAAASPSKKAVSKPVIPDPPERIAEIDARLDALQGEMLADTGEVRVRGEQAGAWRQWADEHPARQGSETDKRVGYEIVDTTALLSRLGDFIVAWNGEDVTAEDRAFLLENAAPGDLTDLCQVVVQMHEAGGFRPKASPQALSATPTSATA
jgi:hypothetical protein